MGVSTDAYLFYGTLLPDPEEDSDIPWDGYDGGEDGEWGQINNWLKDTLTFEEWNSIEIITHCSENYPMYAIALKGTVTCAHRGCPERLNSISALDEITPNASTVIARIQQKLNSEYNGWFLVSWWG